MHAPRFLKHGFSTLLIVATPALVAAQATVKVQVPDSVSAKANAPPPASAQQKTSIGHGAASINTAQTAQDTDSFWTQQVDVDGNGNVEATDALWDDETKVLFLPSQGTFTCMNGNTGDGDLLIALYGKGNTAGRPAGSGWWVASLDAGECAAKSAGLYGCKFNASGASTECGLAMIKEKEQDVMIKPATKIEIGRAHV